MSITAAEFKIRFPEFVSVADVRVTTMITRAGLQVLEGTWETLYNEGLYYLTAHYLYRAEQTAAGALTPSGALVSKSVGDVSLSFSNSTSLDKVEDFYNSTSYGAEFYTLMMIVGIALGAVGWADE